MNTKYTEENKASFDLNFYPDSLNYFPLSQANSRDVCDNIKRNLFQLEKEIAFFSFAIKEIKDITKP